jgi:hypothetical protein
LEMEIRVDYEWERLRYQMFNYIGRKILSILKSNPSIKEAEKGSGGSSGKTLKQNHSTLNLHGFPS